MNNINGKVLLSVRDAAGALSMSRSTLYAEIKKGRLRIIKNGSRTVVAADEIMAYAERAKWGL